MDDSRARPYTVHVVKQRLTLRRPRLSIDTYSV
jgi:hypothetical protein